MSVGGGQTPPTSTAPVAYLNAHWFAQQEVQVIPNFGILRRGAWSLCHGCSNNLHKQHVPVNCSCDLCMDEVPEQAVLELEAG